MCKYASHGVYLGSRVQGPVAIWNGMSVQLHDRPPTILSIKPAMGDLNMVPISIYTYKTWKSVDNSLTSSDLRMSCISQVL